MPRPRDILSASTYICWTCDWNLLNTPWELGTCCICPLHLTPRWGQSHLNAMCMVGLYGVPHSVVVHGVPAMPEAAGEKHVLNGIDLMISRCIQKDSKKSYPPVKSHIVLHRYGQLMVCQINTSCLVAFPSTRPQSDNRKKKYMEAAPARKGHAPKRRHGCFLDNN